MTLEAYGAADEALPLALVYAGVNEEEPFVAFGGSDMLAECTSAASARKTKAAESARKVRARGIAQRLGAQGVGDWKIDNKD